MVKAHVATLDVAAQIEITVCVGLPRQVRRAF